MHTVPLSNRTRAFVADALAWLRSEDETRLLRLLRSPLGGVAHDVGAANATLAQRFGPLFDTLAQARLALPPEERAATQRFVERLRTLRRRAAELDDDTQLGAEILTLFELDESAETAVAAGATKEQPFALCERPERDARLGVRARQQHFSASALNAFAECPRKWYFRYVCGAVEDAGTSASFYGTAFHLALENFHAEFPRPYEADPTLMQIKVREYIDDAFAQHYKDFSSALEVELQRRRARRTAIRYIDWLVAESARAPFTVIGRELAVNLDLDGFAFVGFIDRLDRDESTGNVSVLDYKTGSIATSAAEYRESVRRFLDFQLPFYYWARTAQGDRVTRLALLPLKDAHIEVEPVVLEVVPIPATPARNGDTRIGTIGIDELERARVRMVEICTALTDGSIQSFPVASDPSACTYCAYAIGCSERPPAEREKFGR